VKLFTYLSILFPQVAGETGSGDPQRSSNYQNEAIYPVPGHKFSE
jgi:hypothetical protein